MYVKGVGPARAEILEGKGLRTVEDLLFYPPFRYEDRSSIKALKTLSPGEMATVLCQVHTVRASRFQARNLGLFEVTFTDPLDATSAADLCGTFEGMLVHPVALAATGKLPRGLGDRLRAAAAAH